MANEEHLNILLESIEAWNQWRRENQTITPDLNGVDLRAANLHGANLRGADLTSANLSKADLHNANLRDAHLPWGNLSLTNLYEGDLRGALLQHADLSGANLRRADLRLANLAEANLTQAQLDKSNLNAAYLSRAKVHGASLVEALVRSANLGDTDLSNADIRLADFTGAHLTGADLTRAIAGNSTFADVDLSAVRGMDEVAHSGPSTIGIDTVYLSKGEISVEFLRGAGVPENFVEFMQSLTRVAFEFYSCFISYSGKDQEFADRLFADLRANGVRCWFALNNVQAGKKLHEQIDAAIRVHERLLLILSPNSIGSEWVKTEIAKARKREIDEKRRILFPIRLDISFKDLQEWECFDADRGKDSAREVREYYIPDFTQWKDHDHYREEFDRLLRDLKKDIL